MVEKGIILETKQISKSFGHVEVLKNIDFELHKNEILALLGDNGAGKSTLIKIISGVYEHDGGEIKVFGKNVHFKSPYDARSIGIETIYQDLALFDNLNIMENIYAGKEVVGKGLKRLLGFVDRKTMHKNSQETMNKLGINVDDYFENVNNFSGGQRQSVAISKAIYWGNKIVIMDEPTAALGVKEQGNLMQLIKDLKQHDVSVILIMHNIEQVLQVAERAIILKRGERVGTVNCNQSTECHDNIVKMLM